MIANPQIEQISAADLKKLQSERLQKTVSWAMEKSKFYHDKYQRMGVKAEDIQSIDDIVKLPFMDFTELAQTQPYDILTLPLSGVMRIGWQEEPLKIAKMYTERDIGANVEMMTRALVAIGVNKASVVAVLGNMNDSRLLDVQYALEAIGATAVPMGLNYQQAIKLLEIAAPDILISNPQWILQLIIQTQTTGKDIATYPLDKIVCLNESVQNPLRKHIAERTGTNVYDMLLSAEIGIAGMLYQCSAQHGQHVQEDCYYTEIIEFGGEKAVTGSSAMGELVVTSLINEAMPLIRYRTGQAVKLVGEPCSCGRTFKRLITPFGSLGNF